MIQTVHTMMCDGCGWWDERTQSTVNKTDAVVKGRAIGWTASNGVHLCPGCTGKLVDPGRPVPVVEPPATEAMMAL